MEAVQVGALAAAVAPGIELAVQAPISGTLQTVQDGKGNNTALALANKGIEVRGQDVPKLPLPLVVFGTPAGSGSKPGWGRVVRISTAGAGFDPFFDFGIDDSGNFFINGPGSSPSAHVLAIAKGGIQSSTSAPAGANLKSLFVDTNSGFLYYQQARRHGGTEGGDPVTGTRRLSRNKQSSRGSDSSAALRCRTS